eukprot:6517830-Alexandrium_andersonii.AAC.1
MSASLVGSEMCIRDSVLQADRFSDVRHRGGGSHTCRSAADSHRCNTSYSIHAAMDLSLIHI